MVTHSHRENALLAIAVNDALNMPIRIPSARNMSSESRQKHQPKSQIMKNVTSSLRHNAPNFSEYAEPQSIIILPPTLFYISSSRVKPLSVGRALMLYSALENHAKTTPYKK